MKLIGNKNKGYKLVSSFEKAKSGNTGNPAGEQKENTPTENGNTDPEEDGKEE